jgi:pyrimidine deaminase RibD-like protein
MRGVSIMSLNLLIKTARKSTHRAFHHGTIVLKGGAVLAAGYNHGETHSEISALKRIWPNKRSGCIIINIRVTKRGFSSSKPCDGCMAFIKANGISKVIYSDSNGQFKEMRI